MQMNFRSLRIAMFGAVASLSAGAAWGAAIPVEVNLSDLMTIQSYNVGENAVDQSYVMVSATLDGKTTSERVPKTGTWATGAKQQPVDDKKPQALWKGDIEDGHYAVVTVTLLQGE